MSFENEPGEPLAKAPKVSVIVPNYNHARFLKKRLQSVLDQTFQDFEILYLDDASTDGSAQVFARFQNDLQPRALQIRAISNARNGGIPFKQWNRGVRAARGEYIWLAEADDYADPRLLETLVAQLDAHPEAGIAFCQSWVADENDAIIELEHGGWFIAPEQWQRDFVMMGRGYARDFLFLDNTIPNASAVVFRKAVYEKAGYASEKLRLTGDWRMWHQMLQHGDIAFVAQPLNFFRTHSGSVRAHSTKAGIMAQECYQMARYLFRHLPLSAQQRERVLHRCMDIWREAIFAPNSDRDWKSDCARHWRIFRLARRTDRHAISRLMRHLAFGLLRHRRFYAPARAALKLGGKGCRNEKEFR